MSKDPTAYLRRETKADDRSCVQRERDRAARLAGERYMHERGHFDPWKGERGIRFVPEIEGLPWNPEAPKRIVAYRVERHVEGHWRDGQSRVRSSHGKHYVKGTWINTHWRCAARVPVPHWDYDGNGPAAREAWECQVAHNWLDASVRERAKEREWLASKIGWEIDGMEREEVYRSQEGWPECDAFRPSLALMDSLGL